jgi:hypothetical protein
VNNETEKTIEVYADWLHTETPELMGNLFITHSRGKELFSFEYVDSWLKSKALFAYISGLKPGAISGAVPSS